MSSLTALLWILIVGTLVVAGIYVGKQLLERVRRRYRELKQEILLVQQQVGQVQQQLEQIQQQVGQTQQHLLLEHMADVAARAKEMDLIDSETFNKSIQALHILEMDNLQGEKSYASESK